MKKIVSIVIICAMILSAVIFSVPAIAAGASVRNVDVVFLIDASRSMSKSDPDNLRLTAIKLFLDLCDLEKTNIGFVLFGDNIIYEQQLMPIDTENDRTALKETIDGLTELRGTTDIAIGMKAAVDMIVTDTNTSNDGKFIVFLSDGKTVIPKTNPHRTIEDSEKELEEAVNQAAEIPIPIYSIGLNANGEVDEQALKNISETTYAGEPFITSNSADLMQILSEIYASHSGANYEDLHCYVSNGDYEDIKFNIADSSVIAANIVIMHEGGLDDLKICDANDNDVGLDNENIIISRQDSYSSIKILKPSSGQWRLSIKAPVSVNVDVKLIMTHDFKVNVKFTSDSPIGAGTKLKAEAELTDTLGNSVSDEELLDILDGVLYIRDLDTNETTTVLLNRSKNKFTGDYELIDDHNITVQCVLKSSNADIRSEIVRMEVGSEEFMGADFGGVIKFILIIVGAVIVLIALAALVIKFIGSRGQVLAAGKLSLNVTVQGVAKSPCTYDIGRNSRLKRMITLNHVLNTVFPTDQVEQIMPVLVSKRIKITLKDNCIRFSTVRSVNFSGGQNVKNMVIVSNRGRITLQYSDPSVNSRSSILITYTL